MALSGAYNLLTHNNWIGASLEAIVSQTLAPYAGSERLEVVGEHVMLSPKAALAISAAVQELSANAAKYGAFSIPSGKLRISWTTETGGRIRLAWLERDGPLVHKPTRRGFGTKMIAGVFASETSLSVDLIFDPAGLHCVMFFWPQDPV